MQSRFFILLAALITACGNHTAKEQAETLSDIHFSTRKCNDCPTVYATRPSVKLFATENDSNSIGSLHDGDSLLLDGDGFAQVLFSRRYKAWVQNGGAEKEVYVQGDEVALGKWVNLGAVAEPTLLVFGYTKHNEDSFSNPAFLKCYRKGKCFYTWPFDAYSSMYIDVWNDKGFEPAIPIIRVDYGLEACDYPQTTLLLYWKNNALHKILQDDHSGNEYAGLSSDFVFPSDSLGEKNKLKVFTSLMFNSEEREPGDSDRFDTTIYLFGNNSFQTIYKTHNIR